MGEVRAELSRSEGRSGSSPNVAYDIGGGVRSYLPKIPKTPSCFSVGGWVVVGNGREIGVVGREEGSLPHQ